MDKEKRTLLINILIFSILYIIFVYVMYPWCFKHTIRYLCQIDTPQSSTSEWHTETYIDVFGNHVDILTYYIYGIMIWILICLIMIGIYYYKKKNN